MAEFTPLTGGCLCGGVRFEVTEAPTIAAWCHCTRCQARTGGTASAQARMNPGAVRIVQGEELVSGYQPPDGMVKCFCSVCGAHLFSRAPDDPAPLSVRLGAFDGEPPVLPSLHQFTAYAPSWDPIPDDGLPRYEEQRP
jgi:hypothetical protein